MYIRQNCQAYAMLITHSEIFFFFKSSNAENRAVQDVLRTPKHLLYYSSPTTLIEISSTLFDDWTVWAAGIVQTLIQFKTAYLSYYLWTWFKGR